MRNLKKILSLALALVMVFSLMTFASAKEFNDAADIEFTEAVEVLTALEVIDGVGNNTFNPNGKVTRAQMAKMITLISLGNVSVDAFNGVTVDLNDISGHWAEAYIKYCYSQGIISGKGNGRFDPDANVTAVEAAKMLLVALGYNSDVQVYEGPQWNVNVIRDAQINDIFEDMTGVASNIQISRDQAAQMMYNTLTTGIIEKGSEQSREDGSISDTYTKNDNKTLLQQSFKADIWVGTFDGNDKVSGSGTTVKGEITVTGNVESKYTGASGEGYKTASFPFDFDIANIGEEVKVIYKDGTMGVKGQPDKYDTIYGVYRTNGTTVYNITRADLQDAEKSNTDKDKIKFGGSTYELARDSKVSVGSATIPVVLNYADDDDWTAAQINKSNHENAITTANGLRGQSVDAIKFIANDEGKLIKAYVTEYNVGRVAAVTSSKVTIEGIGAIDIDGNDIYDGIAVDDVVVYTRFYDKDNKDDATFTVTLAETVEGELTGFKATDNVVVGGTTYKLNRKTLKDVTDDEITGVESNDIGTDVRAYLVNGMVAAIQKTEEKGGKFALVLERDGAHIGATVGGVQVNLLLADGTEQAAYVHKDSTQDGTNKLTDIEIGDLIEYSSISDNKVKVYKVAGKATKSGAAAVVDAPVNGKIWNKDTKALTYKNNTTAVAASNATLFVLVDTDGGGKIDATEKTYAYSLRDLGNIALGQYDDSGKTKHDQKIAYFLNDDGLVTAAYLVAGSRPGSGTASTLYGIVTGYTGSRRDSDDTDYQLFTVAVNGGEVKEVRIEALSESAAKIKKGDLVTFDETTNGEYDPKDFEILVTNDDTTSKAPANGKDGWVLGAVDSYKSGSNLLTYFAGTWKNGETGLFEGEGTASSVTTDKDVKIIFVNGKDNKAGDEVGVTKFGTEKGYANILFHLDDDGIVDVMIIESTGEANLAKVGGLVGTGDHKPDKKEIKTAKFGTADKVDVPAPEVVKPDVEGQDKITGDGTDKTGYEVQSEISSANEGTVDLNVKRNSAMLAANKANGEKVTVQYKVEANTRAFDSSIGTHTVDLFFEGEGDAETKTITLTNMNGKKVTILSISVAQATAAPSAAAAPSIDTDLSATAELGAKLSVVATITDADNGGVLSYQWYKAKGDSKVPETDDKVGTDSNEFTPTAAGKYYVVVTNTNSHATTTTTATATSALCTVSEKTTEKTTPKAPTVKIETGGEKGVGVATTELTADAEAVELTVKDFADGTKDCIKFTVDNKANANSTVAVELTAGGQKVADYAAGKDHDLGANLDTPVALVLKVTVSGDTYTEKSFTYSVTIKAAVEVAVVAPEEITAASGTKGNYTFEIKDKKVYAGEEFTVTVTCKSIDGANANGETVTVTYGEGKDAQTKTVAFTDTNKSTPQDLKFTAKESVVKMTANAAATPGA